MLPQGDYIFFMNISPLHYTLMDSPVGKLTLVASAKGLRYLLFANSKEANNTAAMVASGQWQENASNKILMLATAQLAEYFAGKRKHFTIGLDAQGTVFQQQAWRALQQIPYAQTMSYAQQASALGDANKARAVGMANGRNPISIIVPCHRVIGASGALTGFGGGLPNKKLLLELEQQYAA